MRGLKQEAGRKILCYHSRIFYRCVDWNFAKRYTTTTQIKSHLLQMRGLKPLDVFLKVKSITVASFTDAWIETIRLNYLIGFRNVASFTDAWIETKCILRWSSWKMSHLLQMRGLKLHALVSFLLSRKSHLLQMRGLKLISNWIKIINFVSHLLQMRGLKRKAILQGKQNRVASFTDAWIETNMVTRQKKWNKRRIFYRCVDWNQREYRQG